MARYVIRRLIQSVFLLLGIATFNFVILHLAPGGPELVARRPASAERLRRAAAA